MYDFVNSEEFTKEHLSVFVAALLDKEWTEYMEDDLNTFGYNMTVDEFTGWKVDQGLVRYDSHESILAEEIEEVEPIRSCRMCGQQLVFQEEGMCELCLNEYNEHEEENV